MNPLEPANSEQSEGQLLVLSLLVSELLNNRLSELLPEFGTSLESCGGTRPSAQDGSRTINAGSDAVSFESLLHIDVIRAGGCVGRISIGKPIAQSIAGAFLGAETSSAAPRPLTQLEHSALLSFFSTGLATIGAPVWLAEAGEEVVIEGTFSAYRIDFKGMGGALQFTFGSEWVDSADLPLAPVALNGLDSAEPANWLNACHQLELELARMSVSDSTLATLEVGDAFFPGDWSDGPPETGMLFVAGSAVGGAEVKWTETIAAAYRPTVTGNDNPGVSIRCDGPQLSGIELTTLRVGRELVFGGDKGLVLSLYVDDRLLGTAEMVEVESRLGVRLATVSRSHANAPNEGGKCD